MIEPIMLVISSSRKQSRIAWNASIRVCRAHVSEHAAELLGDRVPRRNSPTAWERAQKLDSSSTVSAGAGIRCLISEAGLAIDASGDSASTRLFHRGTVLRAKSIHHSNAPTVDKRTATTIAITRSRGILQQAMTAASRRRGFSLNIGQAVAEHGPVDGPGSGSAVGRGDEI